MINALGINKNSCRFAPVFAFILFYLLSLSCSARESLDQLDNLDLNKAIQNLLAPLKSFFVQDTDFPSTGFSHKSSDVVNIQLVYPFNVGPKWNLITKTNFPIAFRPPITPVQKRARGTSNIISTSYISPKHTRSFRWGIGPAILFPTASNPRLGVREWGGGRPLFCVRKNWQTRCSWCFYNAGMDE